MQDCLLTITTTIDGKSTQLNRDGKCVLSTVSAEILYQDEQSKTTISLRDNALTIVRVGDYSQTLRFKEGCTLEGTLGIAGSVGSIYTKTNRLAYSLSENALLLSLHYTLIVGEEPQEVKVRIFGKVKGEKV